MTQNQHANLQRILVAGPAWVGDMVMAQTLFILLKQQHPNAMIDVLAPAWTLALVDRMPEINVGIPLPIGHGEFKLAQRLAMGKQLRAKQYQQAIILPNTFKSALIPFWAKIPVRTGWSREGRWLLMNDCRKLDPMKYPLMIERFAALAYPKDHPIPAPEKLPKPHFQIATEYLQQALLKYDLHPAEKPILALCPGAEFGSSKRWPPDYYAAVAKEKLAAGWQVWIFGSNKDQAITEEINRATESQCIDLAGKTKLSEAIDLLSLASQVLTNDSGLMHIAAALDRPLVALYGSTSSKFTPPLSERAKILSTDIECRPCFKRECPLQHHKCMRDLNPSKAMEALNELV